MTENVEQKKEQKKKGLWLLLLLLLFSIVVSTVIIVDKLNDYLLDDKDAIPLVPDNNDVTSNANQGGNGSGSNNNGNNGPVYHPSMKVDDSGNVVWGTDTEIDIFSVSYENGENEVTVLSNSNDNIIAPGTSQTYMFKVKNTGDVALDYNLTFDAYITPDDYMIPLESSIRRYDGNYILGSKDSAEDIIALDKAFDVHTVGAGRYIYYVFEWEWPFDGNDELDTMLGNETIEQNITCTIKITTEATISADPDNTTGIRSPYTGDTTNVGLWMMLTLGSMFVVFFLIFLKKEKEKEEQE